MAHRYFGDTPTVIPQEVRASPPSPSQARLPPPGASAQQLANRRPVRASPLLPPATLQQGMLSNRRVPVATILQAGGMNGFGSTVIPAARGVNGAPVFVDPMGRAGSLAAMNMDTSVSAQYRAIKQLGALRADGVPVSGNYTDAIRNAAGFAFGPPRLPKQGYSAASYSYPSQQMVIGATLSGTPIVNRQPVVSSSPNAPRFATRSGGQGPRYQIITSPSEDRRKMLSTLMGLGALDERGRLLVFNEFKSKDPIYKLIDQALDKINQTILAGVSAIGTRAAQCMGTEADAIDCAIYPDSIIKAAQEGRLYALQIDKDRVFAQLVQMLQKQRIELIRTALDASLGATASTIYDILMDVVNVGDKIGVGDQVKAIREFLTFSVPDLLREGWIKFLYAKTMGTNPTRDVLSALMADPGLAATNSYDAAAAYVKNFKVPGAATPGGGGGRLGPIIRSGMIPGLRSRLLNPAMIRGDFARKIREDVKPPPPAKEPESDNTMLYVGAAAVIGAGLFFALRK